MKTLKLILAMPCVLLMQNSFAQSTEPLKLSSTMPAPGEKVTFTYDPSNTVLAGKKPEAIVYFLDNKLYPAADINLKGDGKALKGEFTLPATTKAFVVKFSEGENVDDNDGKGYMYTVYKDKKPVPGAYATEAYLISSGMGNYIAKIKADKPLTADLYKKEFAMYPASEKEFQSNYYFFLNDPKNAESMALLNQKIAMLEKSNKEEDLVLANNLLARGKNKAHVDSLTAVIKSKYPNGLLARSEMMTEFYKQADPNKKDSVLKIYLAKYPDTTAKKTVENGMRLQVAGAYLNKGMLPQYEQQAAMLTDKTNLSSYLNSVAWKWAEKGERLPEAERLSKQSLVLVQTQIDNPASGSLFLSTPAKAKKAAQSTYDMFADTYAFILFKEGKFAEAVVVQKPVYEHNVNADADINEHYAMMLNGAGKYAEAMKVAESSLNAGKSSQGLKDALAVAYVKVKGSDKGYAEYFAALDNSVKDKLRAELTKEMINKPAPAFALKDMDGKSVSLASLKGKTVIVDFWATWCGPCKASFPGMQMAVNKYKNDPNVKFLFVDTWENGDNYLPGVKKFIADNKYTFNVLIDEKGDDGRQSKVVSSFGVDGIPTKFIIDKGGNIRFKHVGYSGSPDKLVDEITNMIEMINSDASQKVSMLIRK
ncbi:TlpA disulfide reductase family protein [Mucilaginibacter glaciei]|uniref:TlpA family protein disulfide reductase n=1 Tax=Mucilaginibacter glaciei TaxID=2772109 RepID=A0A926NP21_9SPHI|nr:TlpA disulfide reductase family protein [Mucilaginibacter glaciei]MBD1392015.1 TlpA family protein disulfide reductase [Mucilaginibacter glaciei]